MMPTWTPELVGERLIEAFRVVPGRPVLSRQGGFSIDGAEVAPFAWPERFLSDARDRRLLMTWASCMASGESVTERYEGLGWGKSTAERRRRAALTTIALGLRRDSNDEARP